MVKDRLIVLWQLKKRKNEEMAFTLPTVFTLGSKSRVSDPSVHPRVDELNNNNDSGNRRRYYDNNLWVSLKQVEWGQYNPYLHYIRRNSGFRFGIQHDNCWFRLYTRNSDKSSQPSPRSNRNRARNRYLLYYGLIISILTIGVPAYAEEGETNNTSNPVAAATGNVTNQAVQFQNNGAPSRQVYGANNSCNGPTMTFSPFYMGNHTTPYDDAMDQQSYTVAENWGMQLNFMIPLDGSTIEICKSIAKKHAAKMDLDYELVRALKCAEIQQKGFMLVPGSRVYHMCSDVVPIVGFKKAIKKEQDKQCKLIPKKYPWQKQKQLCPKKYQPINPQELLNPLAKFTEKPKQSPLVAH